ncbi:MAG: hypothetical protein MUO85_08785 [candidate division Zixibacteria bacterium]|nr:hypothetical protein [candidate division Zixibacteria bacterium]
MAREQNLETSGAVFATFKIKQTTGVDDLHDADIGKAVQITNNYEVSTTGSGSMVLGKLVDLTLTDADNGKRVATVQIAGIMTLPITTTYPAIGNMVVGGASGTVKQAPALTGYDPAGGAIARGTVVSVNGTTDCTLII